MNCCIEQRHLIAHGLASGFIYDATHSYRLAFLHGLIWNLANLALVAWLLFWSKRKLHNQAAIAG